MIRWVLLTVCALWVAQVPTDVKKRLKSGREDVRMAAIRDAEKVGGAAASLLIPVAADDRDARVRDTAFQALTELKGDEVVSALREGLRSRQAKERLVAAEVVGAQRSGELGSDLPPLLVDKDEGVRLAAATAAGLIKARDALDGLIERANDERESIRVRAAAIESSSRIGGDGTVDRLRGWIETGTPLLRTIALAQLKYHDRDGMGDAVEAILSDGSLVADETNRALVMQAIEEAESCRAKGPIPGLIALLDHPRARMRHLAWVTLREITGNELPFVRASWQEWWDHYGADYQVPKQGVKGGPKASSESVASFYGAPITSDRVVFVIDYSGSMRDPGPDGKAKIDSARDALAEALAGLPEEGLFNVIAFGDEPRVFRDELVAVKKKNIDDAVKFLGSAGAKGKTNVYDALVAAFAMKQVDSIVLLSDGAPSAGEYEFYSRIRFQLLRENRTRKLAISVVALQTGDRAQEFLKRLADETGGSYVSR